MYRQQYSMPMDPYGAAPQQYAQQYGQYAQYGQMPGGYGEQPPPGSW